MNKINTLLSIGTLVLFNLSALAGEITEREDCYMAPYATFSAPLTTTVVGLYADGDTGANAKLFWAFFDTSGAQRQNGNFTITANTFTGFVWSAQANSNLQNLDGFLLFCIDSNNNTLIDDNDRLSASAFFIDFDNNDVAFLPVVDVDREDLSENDPSKWNQGMPIRQVQLTFDVNGGDTVTMQYAINHMVDNGDDTTIFIWHSSNDLGPSQSMRIFNNGGLNNTFTVLTPGQYLNIIDLESVAGIDTIFTSGFINWTVPETFSGEGFVFTVIQSPAFAATQTLISFVDQSQPETPPIVILPVPVTTGPNR